MVYSKYGRKVNQWSVFFPKDINYKRRRWGDEHSYVGVQVSYWPDENPSGYSKLKFNITLVTVFGNNGVNMDRLVQFNKEMNSMSYENTKCASDSDIRKDGMYIGGEVELINQLMEIPLVMPFIGATRKLKNDYDILGFDDKGEDKDEPFLRELMKDVIEHPELRRIQR